MNLIAYIALFGWIPTIIGLFACLPPRRAVIYGFLIAWLFLPMSDIRVHGFTDYNKMSAACVGVLLSALIFDNEHLLAFRPKWVDLPMLIWCISPLFSSLHNGLGWYDGIVSSTYQTTDWGLPYLIGRIYFGDLIGLRELAIGIVIGGLVYVPLCLFEVRFSPQLHRIVYGFYQHDFAETIRGGSWRPMVFMQHGLAVAMWMAASALVAFWLWMSGLVKQIWMFPMWLVVAMIGITCLLCRSGNAVILLLAGMTVLIATRITRWPVWVLLLAMVPPVYVYERAMGGWNVDELVNVAAHFDADRASSLKFRVYNENLFIARASQSKVFGWAGWNRFKAENAEGIEVGIPDGMWIIAYGENGLVGLIALMLAIELPMLLLLWRIPARYWATPAVAPAAALAVLLGLHMIDNLMNAMINPIFMLAAGGLGGMAFSLRRQQSAAVAAPPQQAPAAYPASAAMARLPR